MDDAPETHTATKRYRKPMPIFWWVHQWTHIRFITRELTSLFVLFYSIVLLLTIRAVSDGEQAFAHFVQWLQSPLSLVLHAIAFLFLVFHSITWFNLAPKAMVVKIGARRLPDRLIVLSNYAAWLIISVILVWLILFSGGRES